MGHKHNNMVKELEHYLMEESMLGNTRMGKDMVKEHTLITMGENMKGNGNMIYHGSGHNMTKTETLVGNM